MEVLIYEFEQSLAQEFCDIFCLTTVNINLFFNPARSNLYIRNSFKKSH